MMSRRGTRTTVVSAVALLLLVAGCGGGSSKTTTASSSTKSSTTSSSSKSSATDPASSDPSTSDGSGGHAPSNAMYPVKQGNEWQYSVDLGGGSGTEDFVMTKVTPGDGYTDVLWTVTSSFDFGTGSPSSSTQSYTWRFMDDGSVVAPAQSGAAGSTTFTTDGTKGQVFPSIPDMLAGKTLSGSYDASGTSGDGTAFTGHTEWTSTGQGAEDVTVPAGAYPGCAKLLSAVTLTTQGSDVPFGGTANTTQWFALGVGMVRSSVEGGFDMVLVSTNVS